MGAKVWPIKGGYFPSPADKYADVRDESRLLEEVGLTIERAHRPGTAGDQLPLRDAADRGPTT